MELQVCSNKTRVELEILTDVDILLIFKKGIRGGICHAVYQHVKANNKYMKDYDLRIESSHLLYWDVSNLYGWTMPQKLPVDGFK